MSQISKKNSRRVFPSFFYKYYYLERYRNKMKCEYSEINCYFYNAGKCTRSIKEKCLKEIDNTKKIKNDAKNYWNNLRSKKK